MDEELKKLGYDNRSIRSFSDEEKKFLISNNNILPNIKLRIKDQFPKIPDNKLLKVILLSINNDVDELIDSLPIFRPVIQIINSEIRDRKLSQLLEKGKILFYSDFNKFF